MKKKLYNITNIFMYKLCIFIVYYLFVPTNAHIYIKISNYITNASTCSDVSAPSSGSFDIAFAKVIKLLKLHKTVHRFMITFELHMQPLPHFINSTNFIIQRSTV